MIFLRSVVFLLSAMAATSLYAADAAGSSSGLNIQEIATQQANPIEYPKGTCTGVDPGCLETKCQAHADVYKKSYGATLVGQCKTACGTQEGPAHAGKYMAMCIEQGGKNLACVDELVDLNLCLFQAAADPKKSLILTSRK